ncbi:neuraminidase-like domain-containing protein [Paenibacillus sp. MBLB4367]|uniref:neuraminidase-like domain-containing protein n=1 Tax=Paenibacillus sp. MBLB4367 TaxID=3384767 RepID=UPI0039081C0E
MNPIIFPLKRGTVGQDVTNLQDALLFLLERGALFPGNDGQHNERRNEWTNNLKREREANKYGDFTAIVVSQLQNEHGLPFEDHFVDEKTADVVNALLRQWGLLPPLSSANAHMDSPYIVLCQVVDIRDTPIAGLQLQSFHRNENSPPIQLGEAVITDTGGNVAFRFRRTDFSANEGELHPNLFFTAQRGAIQLEDVLPENANDQGVLIAFQPPRKPVVIRVIKHSVVAGVVVQDNGLPAPNLTLFLYQLGFGGNNLLLGSSNTDQSGRYTFRYDPGTTAVNLEIRITDPLNQEKELPLSHPRYGAAAFESWNLVVPAAPSASEYERLKADLLPHVGELTRLADARESDEQQDLTILNRATGWDSRLIARAVLTERLSADQEVNLPQEAIYGLLRAGLPSDKLLLAQVAPDLAEQALIRVRDAGIIALHDDQINQYKEQFVAFANQVRLTIPAPGSTSTYGELLQSSGLHEEARNKFVSVYLNHDGDAEQLWSKVREAGLDDVQVSRLQLHGKLAFLVGNSNAMSAMLMSKKIGASSIFDPSELVDLDFHLPETWRDEVRRLADNDELVLSELIPAAYLDESLENRLNAYTEDLARKIRLSYPTHVVARLLEKDDEDLFRLGAYRINTAKLLKNSARQGFRLGRTPVSAFLNTHTGVSAGMMEHEFMEAGKQLKTLQRIYQLTTGNEGIPVMLHLGITSASDVTAHSEADFLISYNAAFKQLFQKEPAKVEAKLVYRKAKQINSVLYNLFTVARKIDSDVQIAGMSAAADIRENVRNELIKQFPTMESLFGSMDYCECEHCRSVLSPAAYLVDLLQFIDTEPETWKTFLARWDERHDTPYHATYMKPYDALIERRPDLPYLPLTCENTLTVLPYIDIINEILEYYVANGGLSEHASHDTGEATTDQLLAEPQNVIREAYDILRDSLYPLNLPFDLWTETVRQFCSYFDTPLDRLLDIFRPSNDLMAKTQPYDRTAIFMESLGILPIEFAIFTDPNPLSANKWHQLYGYASADSVKPKLKSAKFLSDRLGVSYMELTDIIETNFVNPGMASLGILYRLGVSIHDARAYKLNKELLLQDPNTLSPDDMQRRLEADAFFNRMTTLANALNVQLDQLQNELDAIDFSHVLVLADPYVGCSFDLTVLQYANGDEADDLTFLRINLFVRLWRKLGWTIDETDRALHTFMPSDTPYDSAHLDKQPLQSALIYLSHFKSLDDKLQLGKGSRLKLITLWSDIPTTGNKPLYKQLFLAPSILKSEPVFDDPLGRYLSEKRIADLSKISLFKFRLTQIPPDKQIDPALFAGDPRIELTYDHLEEVQYVAFKGVMSDADKDTLMNIAPLPEFATLLNGVQAKANEFSLIKGHLTSLQGILGLTGDDIEHILVDAKKSLSTAVLSLSNVSLLYRYGLLAKALHLSVSDLITLKQLSGLDPFKPLKPDKLLTLEEDHPFTQTLGFVDIVQEVKDSGVTIGELEYLLRHRDESGKYVPNRADMLALLSKLVDGIRAIRAEHAVPEDPGVLTDEMLRQKLGLIVPIEVAEQFQAMMNGTAEYTASVKVELDAPLHPEDFADEAAIREVRYSDTRKELKLTYRGVLFESDQQVLLSRLPHEHSALLTSLLDDIREQPRSFFVRHLQKQAPDYQPATGFLDSADFDLLFDRYRPLEVDETEDVQLRNREARDRNKRKRIAESFLPFVQDKLIRQYMIQTMTAYIGGDPLLVESLLTDARMLANPGSLLAKLTAAAERGMTASYYASDNCSGDLLKPAETIAVNPFIKPPGANSAHLEGYLEVTQTGAYRFSVVLDKKDAEVDLRFDHLPDPMFWREVAEQDLSVLGESPKHYLELKAGVMYGFALDLRKLNGGGARLLVQGETLPKGSLDQLVLYPKAVIEGAEQSIILLTKANMLLQQLGLGEREARYLLTVGGLNLSLMPTKSGSDTLEGSQAFYKSFRRLASYARLKRELVVNSDQIIEIFEANGAGEPNHAPDNVYTLIAKLFRRNQDLIKSICIALFAKPDFANEQTLLRIWEALKVMERFGVTTSSLVEWTHIVSPAASPMQRFAIAREMKETIKARFDAEAWKRVAQPIFDKLRQRQRDALVSYVKQQLGFASMEQIYEYFLIDPGMEPVVQTSRIRLAISSVQLFIQRCLLNYETKVHPSVINSKQWEWMKRYRVWEANRKIFLFPENWLEPEFRDDKTHLFSELEGALLQGDVSSDLAEDAFLQYLNKLDELARLDVVAMHLEVSENDPSLRILHVIGRTFNQPKKYFYRRLDQSWTPWEPISAEIESNHLAPIVWHGRLYLFWVTLADLSTKEPNVTGNGIEGSLDVFAMTMDKLQTLLGGKNMEIQLYWSEYLHGEWSTRKTSTTILKAEFPRDYDPNDVGIHVSKAYEGGEEQGVYIHLTGSFYNTLFTSFYLAGRNSTPKLVESGKVPRNPYSASDVSATRFTGGNELAVKFKHRLTKRSLIEAKSDPRPDAETSDIILQKGTTFTLLPCNNDIVIGSPEISSLMKPIFYQDDNRMNTIFVEPYVVEQTIEEWNQWIAPPLKVKHPDWWKDIVIMPQKPSLDPNDTSQIVLDPLSRFSLKSHADWLINPQTSLLFDDKVIGPQRSNVVGEAGLHSAISRNISDSILSTQSTGRISL